MTLIARYKIASPLFREALEAVPGMALQVEDIREVPEEPRRFVVRASGSEFEPFETALASDPTVGDYRCLSDLQDKRLYRLTLSETGQQESVYAVIAERDIVPLDERITSDGIHVLARFPSRDAVTAFRDACRKQDISFSLEHLYSEEPLTIDGGTGSRFGVTEAQRESLLHALEAGYFHVPRGAKVETMAEELGISTSAFSTRLRRGQKNLLRHTLAKEPTI